METTQLETLAKMRVAVGYLGERDQFGWWKSSFFAPASGAFLAPVFGRTQLLAQCNGVTRAAALVHDEHIGVGNVYHLFRLPEDVEQSLHRVLHDQELSRTIGALCASKQVALDCLLRESGTLDNAGVGPTSVGTASDLRNEKPWRIVAAHYLHAYNGGSEVYPYFVDKP